MDKIVRELKNLNEALKQIVEILTEISYKL